MQSLLSKASDSTITWHWEVRNIKPNFWSYSVYASWYSEATAENFTVSDALLRYQIYRTTDRQEWTIRVYIDWTNSFEFRQYNTWYSQIKEADWATWHSISLRDYYPWSSWWYCSFQFIYWTFSAITIKKSPDKIWYAKWIVWLWETWYILVFWRLLDWTWWWWRKESWIEKPDSIVTKQLTWSYDYSWASAKTETYTIPYDWIAYFNVNRRDSWSSWGNQNNWIKINWSTVVSARWTVYCRPVRAWDVIEVHTWGSYCSANFQYWSY